MTKMFSIVAVLLIFAAQQAQADSIVLSMTQRPVTAEESGAVSQPAPVGGMVYEFFATTDGDILAINFASTTTDLGDFYQNTFGTAGSEPNGALIPTFPSLAVDSFITTPGGTNVLGGGLPANGDDTFGDTDNDGAQNNFRFAQLTLPGDAVGVFSGQFDIVSTTGGIYSENFSFTLQAIPEPTSLALVGLGMIGLLSTRRRRS